MGLFQFSGSPAGQVTTTGNRQVGAPLASGAFGQLNRTMNGDYLYGGDGFNAAQQAAYNQITPQVQSAFSGGGRFNSGLARVAQTQALGDSFAGLYNNERNRQVQSAGIAPSLSQDVTSNEPYFDNDLATLAGLLGVGGSLLGSDGAGGLLGQLGSAGKSAWDWLSGSAPAVANGLGPGVLGFGGSPGFADALNGTHIDASSGFDVANAGGPGLGGGGGGVGSVPTPPGSSVFDAFAGGGTPGSSLSGAAPGVAGDFSAGGITSGLNLGGLGAGAFGVANGLGPGALGFGGSAGFVPAGISVGGAGAAGGLNLAGAAGGVVNTSLGAAGATGLSAGGAAAGGVAPGFGSLAAAAPLAGFAAMAGLIASGKGRIKASKAAKQKAITNISDQMRAAPRNADGSVSVNIPGLGVQNVVPGDAFAGGPGSVNYWAQMNDLKTPDGGSIRQEEPGKFAYYPPERIAAEQAAKVQHATKFNPASANYGGGSAGQ